METCFLRGLIHSAINFGAFPRSQNAVGSALADHIVRLHLTVSFSTAAGEKRNYIIDGKNPFRQGKAALSQPQGNFSRNRQLKA